MPRSTNAAPPAWIITAADAPDIRVFGLSPKERLTRSLGRADCRCIYVACDEAPQGLPPSGPVLLMRGDAIYDDRLVAALLESHDTLLVTPAHGRDVPIAACVDSARAPEVLILLSGCADGAPHGAAHGLRSVTAGQLAPAYNAKLRKTEPPYLFFPVTEEHTALIEDHAFRASYKGLTDLITKWVWPAPALAAVRVLARYRVHPNTVTLASWVLAVLAFAWFWQGFFLAGLVAAWGMTFLDTVDGKLARCTLTSSRVGDVLDHGLDLVHPPFWWFAWGSGLAAGAGLATGIAVAGYFAGRLLEGIFLAAFKFETHSWRPVDGFFRTITARRNPNLILLSVGAFASRPDLGMVMVAIWTAVSLGFHATRTAQAFAARSRGEAVRPWNEALASTARQTGESPVTTEPESHEKGGAES